MRKKAPRQKSEPTITLINIVFLMLIFFLVAGTLAQPLDSELSLVRAADLTAQPPANALVIDPQGRCPSAARRWTAQTRSCRPYQKQIARRCASCRIATCLRRIWCGLATNCGQQAQSK